MHEGLGLGPPTTVLRYGAGFQNICVHRSCAQLPTVGAADDERHAKVRDATLEVRWIRAYRFPSTSQDPRKIGTFDFMTEIPWYGLRYVLSKCNAQVTSEVSAGGLNALPACGHAIQSHVARL